MTRSDRTTGAPRAAAPPSDPDDAPPDAPALAPGATAPDAPPLPPARFPVALLALIVGHVCLHGAMAGLRMAVPLQALQDGQPGTVVGLLVGLFAVAPLLFALPAGRLADRLGYHRPMALGVALALGGGLLATASQHVVALAACAVLAGAGANVGLLVIQRTAGRMAADPTQRIRVFSWLGLAPAVANLLGPVLAGFLIDHAGMRAAFAALTLLPAFTLLAARQVPREAQHPAPAAVPRAARLGVRALLMRPGMRRLLVVNGLIAAAWDVHTFLVPVLGHAQDLSASAIGLVLGAFATAVASVRLVIPVLAHRLQPDRVLAGAMGVTAAVFAVYPLAGSALAMGACAAVLGLALGAVQPMVLTALHRIAPPDRQGEAIALRAITINAASAGMPMAFGVLGTALGATAVFWMMAALIGGGASLARGLRGD